MQSAVLMTIVALSVVHGIILAKHQESGSHGVQVEEDVHEYDQEPEPRHYGGHEIEHESTGGASGYEEAPAYHPHERPQAAFEKRARVVKHYFESNPHGYHSAYETENGIKAQESGAAEAGGVGTRAHGAYSYTGDDGHVYTVRYTADEHGFHAEGAHLPTPPPSPPAILKALEQNALDEAQGTHDDGSYQEEQEHHEEHLQGAQYHQREEHVQGPQYHHHEGHQLQQAAQAHAHAHPELLYAQAMLHHHASDHYHR